MCKDLSLKFSSIDANGKVISTKEPDSNPEDDSKFFLTLSTRNSSYLLLTISARNGVTHTFTKCSLSIQNLEVDAG